MDDKIKKLISYAIMAPSGENAQPWKFVVHDNTIELHHNETRGSGLYDWNNRGSLVGHGAALENISIASSSLGLNANIELLPNGESSNFVARITLTRGKSAVHPLFNTLATRVSNRKPYRTTLSAHHKKILHTFQCIDSEVQLLFNDDRISIDRLAKIAGTNEKIMLENKQVHNFFFNHVNWTKSEDDVKHMGFYLPTLELAAPAVVGFKLLSKWSRAKWLTKLGVANMVAKQNSAIYAQSGAFVCITVPKNTAYNYIQVGRLTQNFWLTANQAGLSVQPLTGILFLVQHILAGNTKVFSELHNRLMLEMLSDIRNSFKISDDKTVAMMFRVGEGDQPSARSSRFSVSDLTVA